jgi:hypothetical protein
MTEATTTLTRAATHAENPDRVGLKPIHALHCSPGMEEYEQES